MYSVVRSRYVADLRYDQVSKQIQGMKKRRAAVGQALDQDVRYVEVRSLRHALCENFRRGHGFFQHV